MDVGQIRGVCKYIWCVFVYIYVDFILYIHCCRVFMMSWINHYQALTGVHHLSLIWPVWARFNTLSYYHHQIGSMNYYPLFMVGSWNNGVRCMSLYIPKIKIYLDNSKRDPWTNFLIRFLIAKVCGFFCSLFEAWNVIFRILFQHQ